MVRKVVITTIIILVALITFLVLKPEEPDDVVRAFYKDWISYNGNPMADKAYESSGYVTADFADVTTDLISSFDKEAFDPILCAEDKPNNFSTVITEMGSETASVKVILFFDERTSDVGVNLVKDDGDWRISQINCGDTDEKTVDSFQEEGHLNLEGDDWVLVYEKPGSPALTAELELGENAMCVDDGIRTLCFRSAFEEGLRVKVSGEEDEDKIIVKEIEFIRESIIQGTVVNADEENDHLIIMSQDGVEAIPVKISSETAIFGLDEPGREGFELGDIKQGDSVIVKGWTSAVGFNATSVEVTKKSGAQNMQVTGSSGIE
jgi:hypothetical protein